MIVQQKRIHFTPEAIKKNDRQRQLQNRKSNGENTVDWLDQPI